jgi:hypothetical protein
MRSMRGVTTSLALLAGMAAGWHAPAAAQVKITEVMDLRAVFPLGGRQGSTVSVTLVGKHLDDASAVRIVTPGIRVRSVTPVGSSEARAELEIAADAPLGVHRVRVVGKFGISDPVPFVVGQLPEIVEQEPNGSAREAQTLTLPVVVNARFNPAEDVDYFRFRARAGESLVLAVEGAVLDGSPAAGEGKGRRWVDPTLVVTDDTGQTVAECDDFHGPDPIVGMKVPRDGEYVVAVRDLSYQGNTAAAYRLTVGAVPWITSAYPSGGRRGETVDVELNGFNLGDNRRVSVEVPSDAAAVRALVPLPGMANTIPFLADALPETREVEPNDRPEQAQPIRVSSVLNGRLDHAGDVDMARLTLAKGDAVLLAVTSEAVLGSPLDLALSVTDAAGKEIAQNDDERSQYALPNGDPRLQFIAPEAGSYTIAIRDVAGRGEPDGVYRLRVTPMQAGIHLTTFYDNVAIKGAGGSGAILALVQRDWYSGPVRLRIGGLPPGFTGSEAIVTSKLDSAVLTVTAPDDAPIGAVASFWIEGEVVVAGKTRVVRAKPRAQRDQDGEVMWRPSDGCVAAVVPVTEFQIRTDVRRVVGAPGETVHIPLTIRRVPGYTDAFSLNAVQCKFNLSSTPAQFRSVVPVPAGATQVDFTLPIPKDLAPGDYSFAICRGMGHDFRIDRPYPNTPVLWLTVRDPAATVARRDTP